MIRYHDVIQTTRDESKPYTRFHRIYTGPVKVKQYANWMRVMLPGVLVNEGTEHVYFALTVTEDQKQQLINSLDREHRSMGSSWLHRDLLKTLRGY